MLLAIHGPAQSDDNPAPTERRYLDLRQSYSLSGMGVGLDLAIGRGGEILVSNTSQQRQWRLQAGHLLAVAPPPARTAAQPLPADASECVAGSAAPHPGRYCINQQRDQVILYRRQQPVTRFTLPGSYPRAGGLALGDDGAVYLSDAAAARLYRLSPALSLQYRLPLYQRLLRSPGHMLIEGGQLWLIDEGRQELLQFALRQARTPLDHQLLGEELLSLGEYHEALQELKLVGSNQPAIRMMRGRAWYGLGEYQRALGEFSRATGQAEAPSASLWQANTLYRLGRLNEALPIYTRLATRRDDSARPAAFNRAQTLLSLGRDEQARQAFASLQRQWPSDPAIRLGAARAALRRGDPSTAIDQLSPLLNTADMARPAHYYLGLAWLKAGDPEKALPYLQQAAAQGPWFREALTALATAQSALGLSRQAAQTRSTLNTLPQLSATLTTFLLEDQPQ